MSLLQYESLFVRVAHDAPILGLLWLELADGGVEHTDPHLAIIKRVGRELKHSIDHHQVKTIHLVILKRERTRKAGALKRQP